MHRIAIVAVLVLSSLAVSFGRVAASDCTATVSGVSDTGTRIVAEASARCSHSESRDVILRIQQHIPDGFDYGCSRSDLNDNYAGSYYLRTSDYSADQGSRITVFAELVVKDGEHTHKWQGPRSYVSHGSCLDT